MARRKATKADGRRFVDQAFRDRISWTAARVLLARVAADTAPIDPELRAAIGRFLEGHPDPRP